jgi:hypothetical protein
MYLIGIGLLCGAFIPAPCRADTVVSLTGTYGSADKLWGGPPLAVSWTSPNSYDNVSITADLQNLFDGSSFTGTAWLMTQIGPAASVSDEVATAQFLLPAFVFNSTVSLFTGLDLSAGTYYLVLSAPSNAVGVSWLTTYNFFTVVPPPTITTDTGVSYNGDWAASANSSFLPASSFAGPESLDLIFDVSGTPVSSSPEPSTLLMASFAVLLRIIIWKGSCEAPANSGRLEAAKAINDSGRIFVFGINPDSPSIRRGLL